MKCVNCDKPAVYEVTYVASPKAVYCEKCIPQHLTPAVFAGTKRLEEEAPKPKRKLATEDKVSSES